MSNVANSEVPSKEQSIPMYFFGALLIFYIAIIYGDNLEQMYLISSLDHPCRNTSVQFISSGRNTLIIKNSH